MKLVAMLVGSALAASGLMLGTGGRAANSESAASYEVDPVHSSVIFGVTHMGASRFYGRFDKTTGRFDYDESDPAKTKIDVEVDADSIYTANENREKHLKGPDFFNTKQFPKISFKSKSLEKQGDHWRLKGELTLHGVTKPIEAHFEWIGTGEMRGQKRGGFEARFKFKRSDFGMTKFQGGALGDEIRVIVSLEGVQK